VRITRGVAALLLATVLIGAVTGCSSTDAVARVNGEEITRAEFDAIYEQIVAQSGGQLDDETALAYKKQLLEMMIDSALITQEAERLGADLSEEAVTERLSQLMGGADEATIEEQITAAGLTVEDVRKSVRDQLANEFLQEKVSSETSVTTVPQTYSQLSHILVSDERSRTTCTNAPSQARSSQPLRQRTPRTPRALSMAATWVGRPPATTWQSSPPPLTRSMWGRSASLSSRSSGGTSS